ncbi:MAG: helix-turn-helix transcriptional regulator [Anaerolineae bacterium]|nr:helix-turn-helix transcriptional regulator [Anaerolineae bacterium]
MNTPFAQWLQEQLAERDWIPAELAKRAGIQGGSLSHILNGTRKVGPESCIAIAKALNLPPEVVFRRAGLLPETENEGDVTFQEIVEIIKRLNADDRRTLLRIARSFHKSDE